MKFKISLLFLLALQVAWAETSTDSIPKNLPSDETQKIEVQKSEPKKAGILSSLNPVEEDEAIHRGNVFAGATLFLLQGSSDDETLNVIFGDIYEADGYTFTVEGFGGYFIRDAMALGMRAGFSRTHLDIDFSLLDDIADVSQHRKYESNGFFLQPLLKNYLKVFDSKNVYFFNETSLTVEYSYGISQTDDREDISKTRTNSWTFKFGINPGLSIMVLDRFAFESSVGLLGLSSTWMDVEENGKSRSEVVYNIVNFKINLLALDFSLVYFF
ncbi:MAG: hypothetical protein SOZ02_02405 [Hallerella porci]|uniref:hypothetical protein n=1 Tax=Hallerella TaxID=2815788 RepID=UPI000D07BF1D|nr:MULTISPECIES: hypothetical protein [Hallerella]MCI5601613.1 hypothetical protein [Hallerella sp.]MDY3921000.1 hypothetical protein [Hallerella porci]